MNACSPAGVVTVTATPNNIVTVHLTPTAANTIVVGVPFAYPPGSPCRSRTVGSTVTFTPISFRP